MKHLSCFRTGFLLLSLFGLPGLSRADDPKARAMIERMSQVVGGMEKLRSFRDVEYKYTYRDQQTSRADISIERYVFDGELSWAKYSTHDCRIFPDKQGTVIQSFNGKESWVTLDGKLIHDPQAVKQADFKPEDQLLLVCHDVQAIGPWGCVQVRRCPHRGRKDLRSRENLDSKQEWVLYKTLTFCI
jgi:hypothetical protein